MQLLYLIAMMACGLLLLLRTIQHIHINKDNTIYPFVISHPLKNVSKLSLIKEANNFGCKHPLSNIFQWYLHFIVSSLVKTIAVFCCPLQFILGVSNGCYQVWPFLHLGRKWIGLRMSMHFMWFKCYDTECIFCDWMIGQKTNNVLSDG